MIPLLWCCFAHLLILQYPDHHQNLISSYLYYSGPVHKISSQSVHNFLSNVVHRQTDRQTDRQTNATKNITSFAKEVITLSIVAILYRIPLYPQRQHNRIYKILAGTSENHGIFYVEGCRMSLYRPQLSVSHPQSALPTSGLPVWQLQDASVKTVNIVIPFETNVVDVQRGWVSQ